jgi:hypothetical protein
METTSIELQSSRDGFGVPVINGIYLHSIYNPKKEAETFASNHADAIAQKDHILVLGLGFGYHIDAVANFAARFHKNYKIVVIEPNQQLVDLFKANRTFEDKNIEIISSEDVNGIYADINFARLLIKKPAIIKLDTAFNINKDFFTKFLTYKASSQAKDYKKALSNQASNIWGDFDGSFHDRINEIKSQKVVTRREDFLLLALSEITRKDNEVSQ